MKESFSVKNNTEELVLTDDRNFRIVPTSMKGRFFSTGKNKHIEFLFLEILNPFMVAHLLILLILCCGWRSAVRIYLDFDVMQKSSTYK